MTTTAKKAVNHTRQSEAASGHYHFLIQELGKRLDLIRRLDQCLASAEDQDQLREFWSEMKTLEQENVKKLKTLIANQIEKGLF